MAQLLMPQATAVWLIDNTTLTFKQIGDFCDMHELEIQSIADGDVAAHIVGQDPVAAGQLTADEIARCQSDPEASLQLLERHDLPKPKPDKARYTPVSKRQGKPDAIAYLLKRFPQLADAQIMRLIGTTRQTIGRIRDGEHRDQANITPRDPVKLGLCSAKELEAEVARADTAARTREANLAKARATLAARQEGEGARQEEGAGV